MKRIFIDAGHGGKDSGAVAHGLKEKDLTLALALKTRTYLRNVFTGHEIMLSRTKDKPRTLAQRTNAANAWHADFLVSIHINAGGGTGFESFMYNGSFKNKAQTAHIQKMLHEEILSETGFVNRGLKEQNFHMVRSSHMPAVLTENGFIDRLEDATLLKSEAFLKKCAKGHAIGIGRILNLPRKNFSTKESMYRVVTGSFTNHEYAKEQMRLIKQKGFSSFIDPFSSKGETYYRVVTGSFKNKNNAKRRMSALKASGFDSFIVRT